MHGIDASWCSMCRLPRQPAVGTTARRSGRSPVDRFADLRPQLFHVTAAGNADAIVADGLRTAEQVAAAASIPLDGLRASSLRAGAARIRDQAPMLRRRDYETHLDGLTITDWVAMLNSRCFLFPTRKEAEVLIATYAAAGEPQDLLVFDTRQLLAAAADRVEVATCNSGVIGRKKPGCPCRGRDTFRPLVSFDGMPGAVREVTIVDGLDIAGVLTPRVEYASSR